MDRKQLLGLTLVTAIAAAAVIASVTSAEGPAVFKWAENPVTLEGVHEGTEEFTFDFGTVKCNIAMYANGIDSPGGVTSEMQLEPSEYAECTTGTMPTEVILSTGCHWVFASGTSDQGVFEGEVSLKCPKQIIFVIKSGGSTKCTIYLPGQSKLKSVTYTNKEANNIKDITIDIALSGMAYGQEEGVPPNECSTGSKSNGKYTAHPTVRGYNESEMAQSLWIE